MQNTNPVNEQPQVTPTTPEVQPVVNIAPPQADSKVAVKPPAVKIVQPPVKDDEKLFAAVSYLAIVALISLLIKPDSAFVRLHARQSLMLFILYFVSIILLIFLSIANLNLLANLLGSVISFAYLAGSIYSLYMALTGVWWKIPVIGQMSELIPVEIFAKVVKENITGQAGEVKTDYDNRQDTLKAENIEKSGSTPTAAVPEKNIKNTETQSVPPQAVIDQNEKPKD
jgi:uncharacterized membrane protein